MDEYKLCWVFPQWDGFFGGFEAEDRLPSPPTHTFMPVKLTRENGANKLTSRGRRNGRIWCILLVIWQYLEASSTSDSHFLPVIFNQPFLPKIKDKTLVVRRSSRTLSLFLRELINSHVVAFSTRCPPALPCAAEHCVHSVSFSSAAFAAGQRRWPVVFKSLPVIAKRDLQLVCANDINSVLKPKVWAATILMNSSNLIKADIQPKFALWIMEQWRVK